MSEQQKTLSFVGTAIVTLAAAIVTYFATQPAQSTGFENVGKVFFEEFDGSNQAGALEVRAMDPESASLKEFRVEEEDGLWTIPSHYGYPAEATDRLAETSSAFIGLKREALVGRLETDHERFGVIDPLDEENLDPESAGKRITIKDKDGEVLVDLIIGKETDDNDVPETPVVAEQQQTSPSFYVRHPDEKQTYKVSLDLELSTRFSDWIKPDLLELDSSDVRQVNIDNYELVEESDPLGRFKQIFKKQGDQMMFSRETGFGPWTMADLDTETKDLDSAKIDDALRTLDNLKIAGVRKKMDYQGQQLLTADLKVVQIEALASNPQLFNQVLGGLQQELADYGFNLTQDAKTKETICVSDAGQISIGRENGVLYTMQFGKAVSGDDTELEIGFSKSNDDDSNDEPANNTDAEQSDQANSSEEDNENSGDQSESSEEIKNRYLMIRVSFDETLLGEKPTAPVAPVEPTKPEGYVAASPEDENKDDGEDKAPAPEPEPGADPSASNENDQSEDSGDKRPQEFLDYDVAMATYKQQKTEFELKKTQFEESQEDFKERISAGKKLVDELNERFGKWFYVISGDNLESIQLKQDTLVSEKEKPDGEEAGGPAELPARPNINLEDLLPNENTGDNNSDESSTVDEKDKAPASPIDEKSVNNEPPSDSEPAEASNENPSEKSTEEDG